MSADENKGKEAFLSYSRGPGGQRLLSLFLGEAAALLQVGTGAKARVNSAGNNKGAGRTILGSRSGGKLLAVGAILGVNGVDLGTEGGEEALRDCVAG